MIHVHEFKVTMDGNIFELYEEVTSNTLLLMMNGQCIGETYWNRTQQRIEVDIFDECPGDTDLKIKHVFPTAPFEWYLQRQQGQHVLATYTEAKKLVW